MADTYWVLKCVYGNKEIRICKHKRVSTKYKANINPKKHTAAGGNLVTVLLRVMWNFSFGKLKVGGVFI